MLVFISYNISDIIYRFEYQRMTYMLNGCFSDIVSHCDRHEAEFIRTTTGEFLGHGMEVVLVLMITLNLKYKSPKISVTHYTNFSCAVILKFFH